MMGKQKKQEGLFSYSVQLESRIPAQHYLRKIKKALDLSFVRSAVKDVYGYNGNESVDPEVIVKLMVLLFLDDIPSERELMRTLPYRLDYLWFLDYGLDDAIPDHSVLSKARRRWGEAVFCELFITTIWLCYEQGLVGGDKIFADSCLVDANASCDSVVKGSPALIAELRKLYLRESAKLAEEAAALKAELSGAEGSAGRGAVNAGLFSRTDPEAAVVRQGKQPARPRYKHHRAVDSLCGVITAVATTPGGVAEGQVLGALLEQHRENTGRVLETVVGDSHYGTVENYRRCAEQGITAHLKDLSAGQKQRRAGQFGEDRFAYDVGRDVYVCPAGKELRRSSAKPEKRAYEYRAGRKACRHCSLRDQCTKNKNGRSLLRYDDQEVIDRVRAEAKSEAGARDLRERQTKMEGSFGDAANNHGLKRSRWRGLIWQRVQDYLIAACQNLRILIANGLGKDSGALSQRLDSGVMGLIARFFGRIFGLSGAQIRSGMIWGRISG
jgi:transposase